MVEIKSNVAQISKSAEDVFQYLVVPSNYEELMPSRVRSFTSTENSATLDIEGIGNIELAITEKTEFSQIIMVPQNKVPFKFDLQWHIEPTADETTKVFAQINADFNFMMKMMAEKLLADFLNVQVDKLAKKLNA